MHVVLVQVPLGAKSPDPGPVFPLGLRAIGGALRREGHVVSIIDLNLPGGIQDLKDVSRGNNVDVVGLSLRNIDTTSRRKFRYYYLELAQTLALCKKEFPQVPTVVGGAGFSLFARTIMERHREIDFGVYLEGEETMCELVCSLDRPTNVRGLYVRLGDAVVFTGDRLKTLSFTKMEIPIPRSSSPMPTVEVDHTREVARYDFPLCVGIQSQRGCPLGCAYCSYPRLNGRKLRSKEAEQVVHEVESLAAQGVREFMFADSVFDLRRPFAREVCELLIERQVEIRWSAWFGVRGFTEDFLLLASRAGCYRFAFSPDGITKRTLAGMGRNYSPREVWEIVDLARRHPALQFRFTLFASSPGMQYADLLDMVRFFWVTHVSLPNSKCWVAWARILPDTPLYETAVREGFIDEGEELLPVTVSEAKRLFYKSASTDPWATMAFDVLIPTFELLAESRKLLRGARRWAWGTSG